MEPKTNLLNPRDFNRTDYELEEFLIFGVFVAGKNSKTQSQKVKQLLIELNWPDQIFKKLQSMTIVEINDLLKKIKSGQYNRLTKCLYTLAHSDLNLRTCTCEDLEEVPGIGMKTSRFFVVYTRENSNYSILDTHILAWLKQYHSDTPKSTPTNKKQYKMYEKLFLDKCTELNMKPYELDFKIWEERQKSWKKQSGNT